MSLPTLFIVMWSSGYVAGAIGVRYAMPFTMTTLRFAFAAIVLLAIAIVTRAPWPKSFAAYGHLVVVGVLLQSVQAGGVYIGLKMGVPAGIAALIVGTMPAWNALGATLILGERSTWGHWVGLAFGLVGIALVVGNRFVATHGSHPLGYLAVAIGLAGITCGTLYQKRFCAGMDLRSGSFVQLTAATIVVGLGALFGEPRTITWTGAFVGAVLWLSLVNSIGAVSVYFLMLRRNETNRVTSLFHLIAPVSALMAAIALHERFSATMVLGFCVAAFGVYLSTHGKIGKPLPAT